jgi:hypothetical protein
MITACDESPPVERLMEIGMLARNRDQIVGDPRFRRALGVGKGAGQFPLVVRRVRPTAVHIARLTATAVAAFLFALLQPGSSRPVLAPLTALLVVQATSFYTIRRAIRSTVQRVAAVTAGVLCAVGAAAYVPFSWWVLGLLIAATLWLGLVLRLRDAVLDVPISAMLIFSVDSHAAATGRIIDTLVGAAVGLGANLIFAPPRGKPPKEAVGEVSRKMASLLGQMADGLADKPGPQQAAEWVGRTRELRGEMERLDEELAQVEESIGLNPRRPRVDRPVPDDGRPGSEHREVKDPNTAARMGAILGELSAAVRLYAQLIEAAPDSADPIEPRVSTPEAAAGVPEDCPETCSLADDPARTQGREILVGGPRLSVSGPASEWPSPQAPGERQRRSRPAAHSQASQATVPFPRDEHVAMPAGSSRDRLFGASLLRRCHLTYETR